MRRSPCRLKLMIIFTNNGGKCSSDQRRYLQTCFLAWVFWYVQHSLKAIITASSHNTSSQVSKYNVSAGLPQPLFENGWGNPAKMLYFEKLAAGVVLWEEEEALPWTKKKEPSSRFEARRTLFHVGYHARSAGISAGQVRSATVRDFCPALIAPDRARYHRWDSVLLAANLEDGSFFFFCPG